MIESPKKRFMRTPLAKTLADLCLDPAVLAGLDAALLQMTWDSGAGANQESAAALHWQLTGAYKFRDLFLTISIPETPIPRVRLDNLPHEC